MILRAAVGSDVGRRRAANEDHFALAPEIGLYLVADGLGGHVAGQIASEIAAEAALRALQTLQGTGMTLAEKLRYAVISANREVHDTARRRRELAGMGTTLVALLAQEGRAALAHVGDSRAYLVRGGRIRQLTDDHSLVGELVRRQEISAADAREHPQRHVLTRAVGVRPNVEPDLAELTPEAGDVFVLCSDGLTGHVQDDEIAGAAGRLEDPQEAVDSLIRLANERGGEDNITVTVVRCEKSGHSTP
ncbi:MAG: Stp1/IreP family PP2C-type Ser/Thr phosphatase [Deltaproteobacteria bacterium]|nr:Stp1/IreP family PP2C-type Ser/Thr phosphatase [Deltaproteobacteria bacterium]